MKPILQPLESDLKPTIRIYLYYRFVLSLVLIGMFLSGVTQNVLGARDPQLFLYASIVYATANLLSLFVLPVNSLSRSRIRIAFLLLVDVLAQLILIHASGGVSSGLGYLMVVTTAMASIFLRGQLAYAFAALISLALLADTVYLAQSEKVREFFTAGVLGILVFATTSALQFLSERVRKSSLDAAEKTRQAKNIQQVAQNIVERMQTGIVVIDKDQRIELLNDSAYDLLGLNSDKNYVNQAIYVIPQFQAIVNIHNRKDSSPSIIRVGDNNEIRVSVASISLEDSPKNIYYLEDYSSTVQQAQKIKLASLGRLAASIAHEIRNPLGATSHAAQLLRESDELNDADTRMSEIILNNCNRVNEIVENTLSLSRRKAPAFEQINLGAWLVPYIESNYPSCKSFIKLTETEDDIFVRFDPSHLRQVLDNLIQNGLYHSENQNSEPYVELAIGKTKNRHRAFLEVRDNGAGVPTEKIHQIFEPFFTTTEKGSGLGLYICKELAEINHASLRYERSNDSFSCFRLDFQHHQRIR